MQIVMKTGMGGGAGYRPPLPPAPTPDHRQATSSELVRVAVVLTALIANLQTGRHLSMQDRATGWLMTDALLRRYVKTKREDPVRYDHE